MEEIDLEEVMKSFWRKKFQIAIIVLIFVIIGAIYSFKFVVPKYSSKTTLLLASINGMSAVDSKYTDTSVIDRDITINTKLVSTYSELIKSNNILRQVIANLEIEGINEEALKNSITVDNVANTGLIRITVTNTNSELACYIANELANVFKEQIKVYYDIENVQIVDVAEIENEPSNINHKKDIILFGFLGVIVAIGYVFVYNMIDTTIKSIEDVERTTELTVLATLPTLNNLGNSTTSKRSKTSKISEMFKVGGGRYE